MSTTWSDDGMVFLSMWGLFEAFGTGTVRDTPFHEDEPRLDVPSSYYAQEPSSGRRATPTGLPVALLAATATAGSADHIMPASVQGSNAKHYKAKNTITEHETFEGRPHLMVAGPGWGEIADRALAWARDNATTGPALSL